MGKRVLITGASRGIGQAAAFALAKRGYDLFLISQKSSELLKATAEKIAAKYGVKCEYDLCDVGVAKECEALCRRLNESGGVYGIVNNAAISYIGLMTDMSVDEWRRLMEVNLNSVFYICHELVPNMVQNKEGRIINISSVWGSVGASTEVAYSTSKGGINMLTKALAKELAPSNIQVNAIAFGVIDTDMNSCLNDEDMQELRSEIPADRIGTADEAGQMIAEVFEAPAYMTGQIVTMDGGWI